MADASRQQAILQTLNKAQRRAVTSNASTVAILAGPGSGKTHTLTSRVVWLVSVAGHRPQDVVVATFTVKAAREMRERIGRALGTELEKKIVLGTFHSIARRYLASYGNRIGLDPKFGIADDADSRAVITRICKRLGLAIDPAMARGWISKKKSRANDERDPPKPAAKAAKLGSAARSSNLEELERCYKEYQNHLELSNLLDYDDLLVKCVELLRKAPQCVANVRSVLIDEYQDTNGVQYELMKLLSQACGRITVVGDPDQSIYGWRSADVRNLSRMLADFPATDQVALEENYRSSQLILATSLKVIQQDEKRFEKTLKAVHTSGTLPVLRKLQSSAQEGTWIVEELRRASILSGKMITYDDVAILLRSASLSRHVESALGKAGIPYRMVGGFKFYERVEIKTILDYLRVIHQPSNNDALARIINVPKRGAGDATIKALLEEAEQSSQSLWSLVLKHCTGARRARTNIRKPVEQSLTSGLVRLVLDAQKKMETATPEKPCGLLDVINVVLARLDFEEHLKKTYPDEHEGRWANVQEFISLAADFCRETGGADDQLPEIKGLDQVQETEILPKFLANVALATDVQKNDQGLEPTPHVTVSTIHAAKGLEWPVVFIPSAYNGSIPHARSEDDDEERRLLYVAMTRAKALLYLSYPLMGGYGNGEKVTLSGFLTGVQDLFARKGPSLERRNLEELGRILNRKPPPQEKIYGSLKPFEVSMEDDRFPIDPEEGGSGKDFSHESSTETGGARAAKRPRFQPTSGGMSQYQDMSWHQAHSTTMEQSSQFTVSSLPGFVTAGVHLAAGSAAPTPAPAPNGRGLKRVPGKHPSDQRSLREFVGPGIKGPIRTPDGFHAQQQQQQQQQQHMATNRDPTARPAIDPALAGHRLGGGNKTTMMPRAPRTQRGEDHAQPRKHYSQFSSSPTGPGTIPGQPGFDRKGPTAPHTEGGGGEIGSSPPPPSGPTRPASCFHATTCSTPQGSGCLKRPAGLTRPAGIAPMDRLRKPFKPLTINRS